MKPIAHIITGLPVGGSQAMLVKLLATMDASVWPPEVISLLDLGPVGTQLAASGVRVRALGMRERPGDLLAMAKLVRWLRAEPPRLVQTWLYHADLIGGLAARAAGSAPVVWNLRQGNLDPQGDRRSTIWIARICARLSSRLPARIVCCSEASRRAHAKLGYDEAKMVVIPNGFDLGRFRPDEDARRAVRQELRIAPDARLIGMMARLDPQKDHRNFIEAAGHLACQVPDVHFLLCGEAVDEMNTDLRSRIAAGGLDGRVHLLGVRTDVPRLTAALDIASLSSAYGEGFPNVLGEAMACGVPCVATDLGECAEIIGDTGRIVQPRDAAALAAAWRALLDAGEGERRRLGQEARRRIREHFDLSRTSRRYEEIYETLAR